MVDKTMTDKTMTDKTMTDKTMTDKTMTDKANRKTELVEPIRTREQLEDMKQSLKRWCGTRDYILFILGINTGLRISDLLQLKTADIKGKTSLTLKEAKTSKPRTIYLDSVYTELNNYINTLNSEWLFPSRKGDKPISTTQAYRQLRKAAEWTDIYNFGTHSLRKTFGYFHYKTYGNIALLQSILNHSTPEVTLRYIGITEEDKRNTSVALNL